VSHEIRTAMNAVLGLAQVLDREPLTASQRDMVERIQAAGRSLLTILNDILDFSKIEVGQLRIEPRPFDLAGLLARVQSLMGQTSRSTSSRSTAPSSSRFARMKRPAPSFRP
jgi:signal transduction histidine kinase